MIRLQLGNERVMFPVLLDRFGLKGKVDVTVRVKVRTT